jgi:hypothetical protein
MINIGSKLDREFRNGVNANFEEADQRLDTLEGGRIADKAEVNSTIATKEAESIARDNEHKNSTTAHAAENITYTGKITGATNAKQAIEKTDDRITNIVGQTGSSNTEIVDARPSVDGSTNATLKSRLDKMEQRQVTQAKQTATLTEPLNVLNTSQATSFDPTVKGRTLANLALNPATEDGKNYVATFPNRNVGLNLGGTYTYANTKFQNTKSVAPVLMADFAGKVAGSTVENPHIVKAGATSTLQAPSAFTGELSAATYPLLAALGGGTYNWAASPAKTTAGFYDMHLFSFNLIEHIERTYGTIPKTTVADKVAWIKDNVAILKGHWYGFGSSPAGNKAIFHRWSVTHNSWNGVNASHVSGSVTKITNSFSATGGETGRIIDAVDSTGFVHFLAYADPSDGVTASTINTDYVNLEVELKQTAPTTTVKDDFTGKVSGSVVENPHIAKHNIGNATTGLLNPTAFPQEYVTGYANVSTLNAVISTISHSGNGVNAQTVFSFNLLEAVKRKYGFTPPNVQWLKDNITKITANWHGFGSSVGGNKATLIPWRDSNSSWWTGYLVTHSFNTVSKLSRSMLGSDLPLTIDANGFCHWLAYAEPSDGTTASTINTDFIDIELEIKNPFALRIRPTKQTAGLYEVDTTTYNLVNVDPNYTGQKLIDKFPAVVGVQHVQNPAITVQGKNLLPPFTEWTLHANATVKSAYELEHSGNGTTMITFSPSILVSPNQSYTLSGTVVGTSGANAYFDLLVYDANGLTVLDTSEIKPSGALSRTFTIPVNAVTAKARAVVESSATGLFTFTNPQLELGNTATPFEPKNEDVLYAKTVLAGNNSAKDELYKRDGVWYKSKRFENVVLDGALGWTYLDDKTGFKRGKYIFSFGVTNSILTKYEGKILKVGNTNDASDIYSGGNELVISLSDADTGFADVYTPVTDEIKAYFNGWQVKTADGANKPTAWKSIVDGTDAPTQTLAYVSANKATGYTPYQLTYQLATTREEAVTVEGAISLHEGMNQIAVDSGVIVRERVTPVAIGSMAVINSTWAGEEASKLKNRASRILAVYKNGVLDTKWTHRVNGYQHGTDRLEAQKVDYDSTATYEVTYTVLDKQLFTANVTEVIGSYNTNLKTNVDGLTERVADVTGQVSINTQQIINILVRLKAGGL